MKERKNRFVCLPQEKKVTHNSLRSIKSFATPIREIRRVGRKEMRQTPSVEGAVRLSQLVGGMAQRPPDPIARHTLPLEALGP